MPHSRLFKRRNDKRPFEDLSSVEFLSERNDCSLFAFANHSKKRPHNLIFGRLFDHQLVDMFEFGIDPNTFRSSVAFNKIRDSNAHDAGDKSFHFGSKPGLLFQGESFNDECKGLKLKDVREFFMDYFCGERITKLNLLSFDHVLVFTCILPQMYSEMERKNCGLFVNDLPLFFMRHYRIECQPSMNKNLPFIHLSEIGPSIDFHLRRYEIGNDEILKHAKQTSVVKAKKLLNTKPKTKNVFLDKLFKERRGKIFINRSDQNLNKLKVKKMKALRNAKKKNKRIFSSSIKK